METADPPEPPGDDFDYFETFRGVGGDLAEDLASLIRDFMAERVIPVVDVAAEHGVPPARIRAVFTRLLRRITGSSLALRLPVSWYQLVPTPPTSRRSARSALSRSVALP